MNQKATYEVTITSKLEQLPIPDLREAIWSRIEGELDADMPTDDGGGPTPPSSPKGGTMLRFALPSVALLIITYFLFKTNNNPSKPLQNNNNAVSQPINAKTPAASPPPNDNHTITRDRNEPVIYTGTSTPVPGSNSPADSATTATTDILPPVTDNTNQQVAPIVQAPIPAPVKTDTVAGKKPRGVPGITSDDYRIVPTKDSLRKN